MVRRQNIPFIGQTSRARSVQVSNQETLNLMTAIQGDGAKAIATLESAPGLVDLGAVGNGPVRTPQFIEWLHPVDGTTDTYAVFGRHLIRFTVLTGPNVIGTLLDNSNTVRITRGRTHIMLVDGVGGYTYDGTTFQQISDPDFPDAGSSPPASPTHVVYLDSYFIVNDANSDAWYISGIEDPDSWNALDFEAAAVAPDRALALANTESELWLIGDQTCQAYYNSGNPFFPFEVILSATQEVGTTAPQSVAESDEGIFFLGTTPEGGRFVYQIRGQSGRIITADEQSAELQDVSDISGAVGFIYAQAGKSFYCLRLDNSRPTMIYNIRAQAWESRSLLDGSAWRIGGAGLFNGQNIGGSRLTARYYRLDLNDYTDSGSPFLRRRRTMIYHVTNQRMDWWELVVDVQSGTGTVSGGGSDPQIRLRFSDDGGVTWSATISQPLGKQGQRLRRAVFRRLGASRSRIFEVSVFEPAELTLINAYAHVEILED